MIFNRTPYIRESDMIIATSENAVGNRTPTAKTRPSQPPESCADNVRYMKRDNKVMSPRKLTPDVKLQQSSENIKLMTGPAVAAARILCATLTDTSTRVKLSFT